MKPVEYMDKQSTLDCHSMPLIIDGVTLSFPGQTVVENFSMTLPRGKKCVLVGASGSGKSSILRAILGFIAPDKGNIQIDGYAIDGRNIWNLRKKIGYVSQEPQLGTGKVQNILHHPFTYKANASISLDMSQQGQLLERFSLPASILSKEVTDLSGGEKQRIAIIAALLLKRPIYLFDEPTSALDKDNAAVLADLLAQSDMTAMVATHDTRLAGIGDCITLPSRSGNGQTK